MQTNNPYYTISLPGGRGGKWSPGPDGAVRVKLGPKPEAGPEGGPLGARDSCCGCTARRGAASLLTEVCSSWEPPSFCQGEAEGWSVEPGSANWSEGGWVLSCWSSRLSKRSSMTVMSSGTVTPISPPTSHPSRAPFPPPSPCPPDDSELRAEVKKSRGVHMYGVYSWGQGLTVMFSQHAHTRGSTLSAGTTLCQEVSAQGARALRNHIKILPVMLVCWLPPTCGGLRAAQAARLGCHSVRVPVAPSAPAVPAELHPAALH